MTQIEKALDLMRIANQKKDHVVRAANEMAKFLEITKPYAPRDLWPPVDDVLAQYKQTISSIKEF